MLAIKRALNNDELLQLLEQLSKRELTNDELLEQLNQLRRELHKRGRSEAEITPSAPARSSSDEEVDDDDVWDAARISAVKDQILEKHQRSRTVHSSAGREDDNWEEHKYRVLVRHLDSCYGEKNTAGEIPRNPEQVDALITQVVESCSVCTRLRQTQRKEKEQAADQALRKKQDWSLRYKHRLEADEYESDPDHKADGAKAFHGAVITQLNKRLRVQNKCTLAYSPFQNGQNERRNQ